MSCSHRFLLDIASTIPYDVMDLDVVGAEGMGELRMLRFLRILKVAKLLRILRAGRIFERLESYMPIDYSSLELLKFLVSTFMGMHWLACGLNLVYKSELGETSWLEVYFGPEKLYGLNGEVRTVRENKALPKGGHGLSVPRTESFS